MRINLTGPIGRPGRGRGRPQPGTKRPRTTRFLAVGALATLVLGLTAACGDDSDPTKSAEQKKISAGDKLTITTFGEFGYDELIKTWNAEHPDLQVEQTKVSLWDDWKNELNTLLQANKGLPDVVAVEGDFMRRIDLPQALSGLAKVGFFPGSTIGNFVPGSATDLLRHFRQLLGTGAMLLIGMDRIKDVDVLISAYDDAAGVTAAFNLNLLTRINRELDGEDYDLNALVDFVIDRRADGRQSDDSGFDLGFHEPNELIVGDAAVLEWRHQGRVRSLELRLACH